MGSDNKLSLADNSISRPENSDEQEALDQIRSLIKSMHNFMRFTISFIIINPNRTLQNWMDWSAPRRTCISFASFATGKTTSLGL